MGLGVSTGTGTVLLWIVHILLNASQPLVVCITFIGTKNVIQKYLGLCGYMKENNNTKETRQRQKMARRLMSMLLASRHFEKSAQK